MTGRAGEELGGGEDAADEQERDQIVEDEPTSASTCVSNELGLPEWLPQSERRMLERPVYALDIPLHAVMTLLQRFPESPLGLGIVFAQEGKDSHIVAVRDLVRARKGREVGEIGRADAADDVPAQGRRVELPAHR